MASETTGGAAAGAAQGAAAGAVFGPWGAIIGAVVGGAVGYFSGAEKKIAKKYARAAADQKRLQQTMKLAIIRRDTIRSQRAARAQAVAAGTADSGITSSAAQGARSSTDMQGMSALNYFDAQVSADNLFQQYSKKAGKHAQNAEQLDSLLGASVSLAQTGGDLYGLSKQPQQQPAPQTQNPYSSFNSSVSMQNNSGFRTFGSSLNLGQ